MIDYEIVCAKYKYNVQLYNQGRRLYRSCGGGVMHPPFFNVSVFILLYYPPPQPFNLLTPHFQIRGAALVYNIGLQLIAVCDN